MSCRYCRDDASFHKAVHSNTNVLRLAQVAQMVAEVIPTRTKLSFSQLQNYIADISMERRYQYFFWGHADVAVLGTKDNTTFAEEVLG
jgi:hypothetical protein